YHAKYIDEGSQLMIPAPLTQAQTEQVRRLAIAAYKALDCAGMARVDFLLASDSGVLYLNELNTIPGFTTISMYAKMWAASGGALDRRFGELSASTIAANEAWTRREPQRAEAWFYLAGAYAPRVQWRVLRGERLGAARDGKRIKDALERALQLDPTLNDAYFGIGLYHYYAGVAPAAAKLLRWLLFLPGGDQAKGLREMLQARDKGELLRGEADFQLHVVYLWYEHKTE